MRTLGLNFVQIVRSLIRRSLVIRRFVAFNLSRTPLFKIALAFYDSNSRTLPTITKALACPDLANIERQPNSGSISLGGIQQLHHGVRVIAGSYYGPEYALLMQATKGVHEPQEELAFQMVLDRIKSRASVANIHMLELGAFWGFYSIWFLKSFLDADALLIEPDPFNLSSGIKNLKINHVQTRAIFKRAFVACGSQSSHAQCPTINIDSLEYYKIGKPITVLHCDIDGFELDMLAGAQKTFEKRLVEYVFISTHSDHLHQQCLEKLVGLNFVCLAEHNVSESYSNDGLIVAAAQHICDSQPIPVSRRVPS